VVPSLAELEILKFLKAMGKETQFPWYSKGKEIGVSNCPKDFQFQGFWTRVYNSKGFEQGFTILRVFPLGQFQFQRARKLEFFLGQWARKPNFHLGSNCNVSLANFYFFLMSLIFWRVSWRSAPVLLCFVSPLFIGFWKIFFVPDFQTLRVLCTWTKTLLVAAYTQKHFVSHIVLRKASLLSSWI
jgi:hypothetical protein